MSDSKVYRVLVGTLYYAAAIALAIVVVSIGWGRGAPRHAPAEASAVTERAPPPVVPASEAARTVCLPYAQIESYFEQAPPSPPEDVRALVQERQRLYGFQMSEAVECRGGVCRAVLSTANEVAARQLKEMLVPSDMDVVYRAEIRDLSEVEITAFTTTPGVRFADVVRKER